MTRMADDPSVSAELEIPVSKSKFEIAARAYAGQGLLLCCKK